MLPLTAVSLIAFACAPDIDDFADFDDFDVERSAPDGKGGGGKGGGGPKPAPPPCPYEAVDNPTGISTELIVGNIGEPLLALGHPTKPDELYIVDRGGDIKVVDMNTGTEQAEPFLTVDTVVFVEVGLLGFAFHPYYPDDPRVYVNYTPQGERMTRISEFTIDLDANVAIKGSERVILELHQPAFNHNGGMIAFGPDDYLYIGMGDGGRFDDAFDTGGDFEVLLSKMLRIDVEPTGVADKDPVSCQGCPQYGPFDYGIPADNPFVKDPNGADEIWATGFRNPWRFAFDKTGELYVADVGQEDIEEIDVVASGADYGWSDMEGFHCFKNAPCQPGNPGVPNHTNDDGLTYPIHEYDHSNGNCSITGGNVYRSCEVPAWSGTYFFGDYCAGRIDALIWNGKTVTLPDPDGEVLDTPLSSNVLGFGGNAWGDVFICTSDGDVLRIVPS